MSNITRTIFVLDSSGSMESCADSIVELFNASVNRIVADSGTYNLDFYAGLILFGSRQGDILYQRPMERLTHHSQNKFKLQPGQYEPFGSTPLYDAMGRAIELLDEYDRPGSDEAFLVQTFTDGWNNSSTTKWASPQFLASEIQKRQRAGNWTFSFAGANIDVDKLASEIYIPRGNVVTYTTTDFGVSQFEDQHVNSLGSYALMRAGGSKSASSFYDQSAVPSGDEQVQLSSSKGIIRRHPEALVADQNKPV